MFSFLKRLTLFGVFLLLGLEITFRTVVPAAEMPAGYQDPDYRIMRLDQDHNLDGHNTMGRLGRPRFAWHVNNYGFNSAYDYRAPDQRDKPCVAVIGNSYTQGLYSDAAEHLAGRIQTTLASSAEVYNLGTSGMPLSQCPRVVEYARDTFAPDLIVIQAGSGSVKGSLRNNGLIPLCQQYVWEDQELTALPPSRFSVNKRNRILRRSALVRYLFYNSNFNLGGQGNVQQAVQAPKTDPTVSPDDNENLTLVVERTLADIRNLVPTTPILIVFDADRASLYSSGQTPDRLRNSPLLEKACRDFDIHFLDLTPTFSAAYLANGEELNFEDNYHWNPYGVGLVSEAIMSKLTDVNLLAGGRLKVSPSAAD